MSIDVHTFPDEIRFKPNTIQYGPTVKEQNVAGEKILINQKAHTRKCVISKTKDKR